MSNFLSTCGLVSGTVAFLLMTGLVYAADDSLTVLDNIAPSGWDIDATSDVHTLTAPMEDGRVFIELRRFDNPSKVADLDNRLSIAKSTIGDLDEAARFNDTPPSRSNRIKDGAIRQFDAHYVLNGIQVTSWVVVLKGRAPGEELLWRYVAPSLVFEDYLQDAVSVRERLAGVIGQDKPAAPAPVKTPPVSAAPSPQNETASQSPQPAYDPVELAFWNAIANSSNPAEFEAYLTRYPDGAFADLAGLRLKSLKNTQALPAREPSAAKASPPAPEIPAPAPVTAKAGLTDCDRLAADPKDPDAVALGPNDDLAIIDDPSRALEACEQALAEFPNETRFMTQLARVYLSFTDERNNPQKAIDHYKKAASLGSRQAMYSLGMLARDGMLAEDGRHHMEEAAYWLQQAAERDHVAAMTHLALVLESGEGMAPDYQKAAGYLVAAAKAGDEGAIDALLTYPESRAGETLKAVQMHLFRLGYYHGEIDGRFGPASKKALVTFLRQSQ